MIRHQSSRQWSVVCRSTGRGHQVLPWGPPVGSRPGLSRARARRACHGLSTMLALLLACATVRAQVATGTPPFGSFSGGPDIVNNANLNAHLSIPVLVKPGRGLPFYYVLSYDSSVWYPSLVNGTNIWTPVNNWGWRAITEVATGYVSYKTILNHHCRDQFGGLTSGTVYSGWQYHDQLGVTHFVWPPLVLDDGGSPCYPLTTNATGKMGDGSGYTLTVDTSLGAPDPALTTVTSPSGKVINPVSLQTGGGAATATDANGNQIKASVLGGNTTFTDTLATTALTAAGAGTQSSPIRLTYTGAGGGLTTVTMNYIPKTVQTNFGYNSGCTGITEDGASAQNLVNTIVITSGTSIYTYTIGYEATPGYPANTTGRIASIQLPSGGTISYTYTGANNGITCADGSTSGLTRKVDDNNGTISTWTYVHSESGTAWTTTVTTPESNVTMHFQNIYETSRTLPGAPGGVVTCYNTNTINCDTTAITLPITQRTVTSTLGNLAAQTNTTYNAYGLPTETDEYGYGNGVVGPLVRKATLTYANGNACGVTNVNVVSPPCAVRVYDGAGILKAETDNTYDANGNLLTETHLNTGGSPAFISRSFTYTSNGVLASATDFNGRTTTYSNTSCGNAFPTSIAPPLIPATTLAWNCAGGVMSGATDANGQLTSLSYDNMNRLVQSSNPDGGLSKIQYTGATITDYCTLLSGAVTGFCGGQARQDETASDGLGRAITNTLVTDTAGPDIVKTSYDAMGRVASRTNPYRGSPAGGDSFGYDTLSRITSVIHADNNTGTVAYTVATPLCGGPVALGVTTTDEAGKQRRIITDALGRTVQVDEPNPPSQTPSVNTCYTYDVLGNLRTVTQGVQTRTYNYDMLSRLTSASTPESGTTTYTYDANGNVKTRQDARSITTTYSYDALNRLTQKTYSDTTPTASFYYDESFTIGTTTMSNTKGRLSHTWNGQANTTYSYDALGRITDHWQSEPAHPALWNTHYTYDLAGDLATSVRPVYFPAGNNVSTVTYNYGPDQRVSSVTNSYADALHAGTVAQNITYTPFGAIKQLVNGCVGTNCTQVQETYDYNNRLQPVRIQLGTVSTPNANSCLVYNYYANYANPTTCTNAPGQPAVGNNGNVIGYYNMDNSNPGFTHMMTYGYDSLNRLAWSSETNGWAQYLTFSYDVFGNMSCSGGTGLCPAITYSPTTNRITAVGGTSVNFDAAGNQTSDPTNVPPRSYQWDAEGELLTVDGGTTATYTYNALGERVQAVYAGDAYPGTFVYLFDPSGDELSMCDGNTGSGGLCKYNSWVKLGGRTLADYHGQGASWFVHPNNIGSSGMVTTYNGGLIQDAIYYPWGQVRAHNGWADERFSEGQEMETFFTPWLKPTNARKYNPNLGRWLSPDPLAGDVSNPQSLNRYAYVMNNPTNLVDPSGLGPCPPNPGPGDPGCIEVIAQGPPPISTVSDPSTGGFDGGAGGSGYGPDSLAGDKTRGDSPGLPLIFIGGKKGPGGNSAAPPTAAVKAATEFCQDRGQLAFNIPFTKIPVTMSLSFTAVVVNFSTTNDITPVAPALPIPPFVSVGAGVDWTFNAPTTPSASVSVGVGKNASVGTYLTPKGLQGLTVSGGISFGPPVVVSAPPGNACGKLAGKSGG